MPLLRLALITLLLAACASAPERPRSLADFELLSRRAAAEQGVEALSGLDPVHDWRLLLRLLNAEADLESTARGRSLFIAGVETLDLEQAQALATFPGGKLFLPDLRQLAPEVAAALASGHHELFLDGLQTISTEAAQALVQGGARQLSLKGVGALEPAAAAALAELDGSLHLDGLGAASPEVMRVLCRWEAWGEQVVLHLGLVEPGVDELRTLAQVRGWGIALDQVRELPPSVARAMAQIQRPFLSLGGLRTITGEGAVAMSSWHAKFLLLDGLVSLSSQHRALIEQGCAALSTRSLRSPVAPSPSAAHSESPESE